MTDPNKVPETPDQQHPQTPPTTDGHDDTIAPQDVVDPGEFPDADDEG